MRLHRVIRQNIERSVRELGFSFMGLLQGLLGTEERFQALPYVDTIYYPKSREQAETSIFPSLAPTLEEDIHLYQFRRSSAGWFLELLNRQFCQLVEGYNTGKLPSKLSELKESYHSLMAYRNAIATPLELEARCLLMTYIILFPVEEIHEGFLETFSLQAQTDNLKEARAAIEGEILKNWQVQLRKRLQLSDRELMSTSQWLQKISGILGQIAQEKAQGSITGEAYISQLGNCLETMTGPFVAALMPPEMPPMNFLGTVHDPEERMELAAKALLRVPSQAIREGDAGELMSRIEEVIPVLDKHAIMKKRKQAAEQVKAEWPKEPLITLRVAYESLDDELQREWVPPSAVCSEVKDQYGPSIRLFKGDKGKVRPSIDDVLGERFLNELKLLSQGIAIIHS